MISPVKKIIFYLILIISPILFLLLIEGILQITVSFEKNAIASEVRYDNIDWYQINRDYLKEYFPAGTPLIPEFKTILFKKNKDKNLFRVICLGGSSMFGTPYQMNANISGILRKQLRHLYPEKEIEVLNFGASAINSNVISQFSRELIPFEPDLVLIYMGHNEFYGPGGVGASFLQKKMPGFTSFLKESKIYKLMQKLVIPDKPQQPEKKNLMKQVSKGSLVKLDSDDAERVFNLYRKNLFAMIDLFRNHNIPVIVSDICSNLDFPPFVSDSLIDGEQIKRIIKKAKKSFIRANEPGIESSLEYLREINIKDSTNAEINFRLGKLYLASDKIEQAKLHFVKASNYDLLKFRAPDKINIIIKEICESKNIPFVSSLEKFYQNSENGIPGYDLIWEHLHPNVKGYYLIADAFLSEIVKLKFISQKEIKYEDRLPFNMEQLSIPWLDLAFADRAIKNLTGNWPFQNFKCETKILDQGDKNLKEIVEGVYQRKLMFEEGCYKSAFYFEKIKDFKNAELTYHAILEENPYNFYAHYKLGDFYKNINILDKAIKHYKASNKSNPDYYYPYVGLGMLQVNTGLFDEAIQNLLLAEKIIGKQNKPKVRANIYYGLSAAYANKKEYNKAKDFIDKSLKYFPNYESAKIMQKKLLSFSKKKD